MRIIALDCGTKRIGIAFADTNVRIAIPRGMIAAGEDGIKKILDAYRLEKADLIVVGLPRNNQGEETAQSKLVRQFVVSLKRAFKYYENFEPIIKFQDESLTSVEAEKRFGKEVSRTERDTGKVDAEAAAIILQDFLETIDLNRLKEEINESK